MIEKPILALGSVLIGGGIYLAIVAYLMFKEINL